MDDTTKLVSLQDELSRVQQRLHDSHLSDLSYRALVEKKNELISQIQGLEIKIQDAHTAFNRSLNNSIQL